jgi:hypothetical protein
MVRGSTWGDYVKKIAMAMLLLTFSCAFAQNEKPAGAADTDKLPLHLGIVLRASKTTFPWQQAAATELVKQLIHNGDEAFVITAGGEHSWPYPRLDWENNAESLTKFIKGLDKNAGLPEPFKFEVMSASTAESREYITKYEGASPEASVFAIAAAMMKSDSKPARHVLIMFRDPWDHAPGWGSSYAQYVDQRHDIVLSILKNAGVEVNVIGIEDVTTRPHVQSDIGATYGSTQSNDAGGSLRQLDEQVRRQIDFMTAAGRKNLERITKTTGGEIAYGTKKNYSDAVPVMVGKINNPAGAVAVGK